jgi:hypothetical protein
MRRFAIVALVVDLLACDPGYQSGKTKCSDSNTCPSGYECVSGVCANPKDAIYCKPQASDTACTTCDRAACCSEIISCFGDTNCAALESCLSDCTTSSCKTNCRSTYSAGVSGDNDWSVCLNNQCYSACSTPSSTGGSGSGGTPAGGGGGGAGGSGGAGGTSGTGNTSGMGSVKFCHGLTQGGSSMTLTLSVNGTKLTTSTGNCAPVASCLQVAAGSALPFALLNGSTTLYTGTLNLEAGAEELVRPGLDSNKAVTISAYDANGICSGGTGTSGTLAKFCNFLQVNHADFTATMKLGSATFSAMTGSCSPVASCTSIPSGTNVSLSLLNGSTSIFTGTFPTINSGSNMVFTAEMDTAGTSATVFGSPYATGICSAGGGSSGGDIVGGGRPWSPAFEKLEMVRQAVSLDQASSGAGEYETALPQAAVRDPSVEIDRSATYQSMRR